MVDERSSLTKAINKTKNVFRSANYGAMNDQKNFDTLDTKQKYRKLRLVLNLNLCVCCVCFLFINFEYEYIYIYNMNEECFNFVLIHFKAFLYNIIISLDKN